MPLPTTNLQPTCHFDSWQDLKAHVTDTVQSGIDGVNITEVWFRGQGNSDWPLVSGFDRRHAALPLQKRLRIHHQMLVAFRERGQLVADIAERTDEELYALLQHHGAPTKLLDWSNSPYIAAYFAATAISEQMHGTDHERCAICVLNTSSPIWDIGAGVRLARLRTISDARIFNQRGNFTLNESLSPTLEQYIMEFAKTPQSRPQWVLQKWTLPAREAHSILRDLELMGISSETMFPGLDGSSRYAYFRALIEASTDSK